ncbi:MAG: DUF2292 domain-containing protein [Sphingobium sp.]|jgi:hypothetical protein|nr:MAG: DUF2292 domain-containing protein [Sphingobium sp.]
MSEHDINHAAVRAEHRAEPRHDIAVSIDAVRAALEALRFGSITLTVHDARVVQLDVTEKRRFTA